MGDLTLSRAERRLVTKAVREAFARGRDAGRGEVLAGLSAVAKLNGSHPRGRVPGRVPKSHPPDEPEPAAPPADDGDDPHHLLYDAILSLAEEGADADTLHHLAGLSDDPSEFEAAVGGGRVAKGLRRLVLKAWTAELHPRGKDGRFIPKKEIEQAKHDPAKAAELRQRVRPGDEAKLDAAIDGSYDHRNKRELAKADARKRREDRGAAHARAKELTALVHADAHEPHHWSELAELLPHLTGEQLTNLRVAAHHHGAKFGAGKSPTRRQKVDALVAFARAKASRARAAAEGPGGPDLSPEEKRAVGSYKNAGHVGVNRSLRSGKMDPRDEATVGALDSAAAKSPLPEPVTVYRGFGNRDLIADNGFPADPEPGDTFTDPGYSSTTTDPGLVRRKWATRPNDVHAEIRVPAGVGGIHTDPHVTGQEAENEILLERGLTYRVVAREPHPSGRGYKLTLAVVPKGESPAAKAAPEAPPGPMNAAVDAVVPPRDVLHAAIRDVLAAEGIPPGRAHQNTYTVSDALSARGMTVPTRDVLAALYELQGRTGPHEPQRPR